MSARVAREAMTEERWFDEAVHRFGPRSGDWKFVCPACGHVATLGECREAGMPDSTFAFSCIGRWLPKCRDAFGEDGPGPCNYAGGGLINLNPVRVRRSDGRVTAYFDFAEPTAKASG